MSEAVAFTILWTALAIAVFSIAKLYADLKVERELRRREQRWIRDNLTRIRVEVIGSPEAEAIVNSLLVALPILGPVDVEGLDQQLYLIRSHHRANLLKACGATGKARP
jgi:hypothetical protein